MTCGICYPLGLHGLYKCFKIHKIAKILAFSLFLNLFFLELGPHKEFRFIQNAIPGKKCRISLPSVEFEIPAGTNFDPVKIAKETLSCEMDFDPLASHNVFSGCSPIICSK